MATRPTQLDQADRPVWMSKYGPSDFTRFDDKTASHVRVARKTLRAVEIECRFAFRKSRWGTIGETRQPAGIIYMDIDFRQPSDCRLQSATVTVTLDEAANDKNNDDSTHRCEPREPVHFTDFYGPKGLRGQEASVLTRKTKSITPSFELFRYGAGGVGVDTEKFTKTTSRWKFTGHISSTADGSWFNNKLEWVLEENSLEAETAHSNIIHTAFAFAHNTKKVYIDVHIQGKLAQRSDRIKEKLKPKWKFGGKKEQGITTKIQWNNNYSSWASLDPVAENLAEEMYFENLLEIPIEIPDTLPLESHPAGVHLAARAKSASTLDTAMVTTTMNENFHQQPGQSEPLTRTEHRTLKSKPIPVSITKYEKPLQHFASPTLENISQIANLLSSTDTLAPSGPTLKPFGRDSSVRQPHINHDESLLSDQGSSAGTTLIEGGDETSYPTSTSYRPSPPRSLEHHESLIGARSHVNLKPSHQLPQRDQDKRPLNSHQEDSLTKPSHPLPAAVASAYHLNGSILLTLLQWLASLRIIVSLTVLNMTRYRYAVYNAASPQKTVVDPHGDDKFSLKRERGEFNGSGEGKMISSDNPATKGQEDFGASSLYQGGRTKIFDDMDSNDEEREMRPRVILVRPPWDNEDDAD